MSNIREELHTGEQQNGRTKTHHVGFDAIAPGEALKHLIATDLPGRFPITSARGHKYLFLMYDYDANYIHAVPIKSRESAELVRGSPPGDAA